jgi:hypothetical protein
MILPRTPPALTRLRVKPDEPAEGPPNGPKPIPRSHRPPGARRAWDDLTVKTVRHLFEQTTLSYAEIRERTGVCEPTISHWKRSYGWTRPPLAPRSSCDVPLWRAGPSQKLSTLTVRLLAIAERMVRELEDNPDTDLDTLMRAFQIVKMAKLAAQGNRRRWAFLGPSRTGQQTLEQDQAVRAALKEMRRGGVDIDRAPQEALDLVIDANLPIEKDHPALRPRGARRR